jgi:DNA-binding IclR family transcriptional regulator
MQIVESLAAAPEGRSLAQLAQLLGIPKTSLLNHLRVMLGTAYVALNDARYVLGPAAIRLGIVIAAGASVLATVGPVARRLAEESGETTLCAMLDEINRQAVYIEVLEGRQPIRYSPAVGVRRPLYCTAMGRALLACQDDAFLDGYLDGAKFKRFNATTVTDRSQLRKLLDRVRAERLAVTVGEHTDGVGAIAAPIVERQGRVRYSIGLAVPSSRMLPDRERLARLVRSAAERASWALGA